MRGAGNELALTLGLFQQLVPQVAVYLCAGGGGGGLLLPWQPQLLGFWGGWARRQGEGKEGVDEGWGRRGGCVPVIVGGHIQSPPTVSLGGQEERDGPSSQPGFIWVRPLAGEVSSCVPGDKWTISVGREGERERFLHFNLGQGCPSEAARGLGGAGGQNPRGASGEGERE